MHDDRHINWILAQLPELVQAQLLGSDTAETLAAHYRSMLSNKSRQNRLSVALAVVGAVLIGGGIILLFAHNWSHFSRPFRAFLSFLPLITAQGLTVYAFLRKRHSRPWQEATAIVHALMIGSSLALIGQTYHLPSSIPSFMLTWVLLSIPMVWAVHSVSLHVLIHIGVLTWFFQATGTVSRNLIMLALAAALVPSVIPVRRLSVPGAGSRVIRWSAAIVLLCIIPNMLIRDIGSTILIAFSLLLSIYSLVESGPRYRDRTFSDRPFAFIGSAGVFVILLLCTIPEIWSEFILHRESAANNTVIFALLFSAAGLLITHRKHLNPARWILGLTGPLTFFAALISAKGSSKLVFYWVFCAWLAALGIALLASGIRERRLAPVNAGMAVLLIHIFIQFMRSDIGYLARSLVFIVLGILFLSCNRILSARWRSQS